MLSIVRLRSSELAQHEVAYCFAALAMGLVAGLGSADLAVSGGLMALVPAMMVVGDFLGLLKRYREQVVNLDQAYPDETALEAALEGCWVAACIASR